eukprot:TRINITY_DN24111_c0_g1_i1.p1 TRINITY_DN24111_c0_g1~~TRINITY_DN24111_c0_g1_i1.p1  ORF type:complete len:804 (-),score=180.08 TRINITY_DN24111_c0_g1_i1:495-2906(-)
MAGAANRLLLCFSFAACAAAQVKIGGIIQDTGIGANGKEAFLLYKTWTEDAAQAGLGYTLSWSWKTYASGTVAADTADFTAGDNMVDVLITPYGSGDSAAVINAIDAAYAGIVLIWGGASDSLFETTCAGKNFKCFGFFTKGSEYVTTGLNAIDSEVSRSLSVLLIENFNGFSASTCDGANATIASSAGLTYAGSLSFSQKSSVTEAEKTELATAMEDKPDIVVVCGHNGFVEPVVAKIAEGTWSPTAIIATNSLTSTAITAIGDEANCLMMPTQWAEDATAKDTVLGWTTAWFKGQLADRATYHSASAAAAMVALANALNTDATAANLGTTMAGMAEVPSFYGPLDWNADGSIKKPMYTQQKQNANIDIVAPTGAVKQPLKTCSSWGLLKVGGPVQTTGIGAAGKEAYIKWAVWVNSQTDLSYFVDLTWKTYNSTTLAADVTAFTTAGNADYVDVLVGPYGSAGSIATIAEINAAYTGPVMVWGGASDTIFDTTCSGKNFKCYGFFTVGSKYMQTGLEAVDAAESGTVKVLLVENANAFSKAVCDGADALISSTAGLSKAARVAFSEMSSINATELAELKKLLDAHTPDVVAVCGHNGFVEPAIKLVGNATTLPKAIIATNGLTNVAALGDKASCVMMPTQWAESATATDSIVGWTTASFKTALGDKATYHAASAGASAISISHAMKAADNKVATLAAKLASLAQFETFYGPVDFDSKGKISKPMYTQQRQGTANKIVAPAAAATSANMSHPLSTCSGWSGDVHDHSDHDDGSTTDSAVSVSVAFQPAAATTFVLIAAMLLP